METYKRIFADVDFNSIQNASFFSANGIGSTILRLIYNGKSYKMNENGSVTIGGNFTLWVFRTPKDRWDLAHFAPLGLAETLAEVAEDTDAAPIVAWDNFFAFANANILTVNAAILGNTSGIKIAYRDVDLPVCNDLHNFAAFARWLSANCGEAGQVETAHFINGKDIIIPLDVYVAQPVRFTLRQAPKHSDIYAGGGDVLVAEGITCTYGMQDGMYTVPVLKVAAEALTLIYSDVATTDTNGAAVPAGWSSYDGSGYAAYDLEANPIVIEYAEGLEYSFYAREFFNIEYETTEADIYRVRTSVDTVAIPEGFRAEINSGSTPGVITYANGLLMLFVGKTEDNMRQYVYTPAEYTYEGITFAPGWYVDNVLTGEFVPYDMENYPIELQLIEGECTVTDEAAFAEIAEHVGTETVRKEILNGTFHFIFRT